MELTDYQRIELIRKFKEFPSDMKFAEFLGLKNSQAFYDIKAGRHRLSRKIIDTIVNKIPEINKDWLLTGNGEMFSSVPAPLTVSGDTGNYQHVVGNDNNVVGNNSTLYNICDGEKHTHHIIGCKEGKIIEIDINTIKNMSLEEFCLGNDLRPFDPDKQIPERTFTYTMCSKELIPYLCPGDRICIKKIAPEEVIYGESYLVDTKNDGKMIKRVEIDSDGNYTLRLPLDVPDYPTITRPASEIYAFYDLVCRIQDKPTAQFEHPLYVNEMMKQISELVKFAQQAIGNNETAMRNAEKALNNQETTLALLRDAMKIISKIQDGGK